MKRRIGEHPDTAAARFAMESADSNVLRGLRRSFVWVFSHVGQFVLYAAAANSLFYDYGDRMLGGVFLVGALILRHTLIASRNSVLERLVMMEMSVRAENPDARHDSVELPPLS